jgi:tyrosyl-tRNA synthetase
LRSREEIKALDKLVTTAPEKREAQQSLARDVTARIHGDAAARVAEEGSKVLFGKGDPRSLSEQVLEALSNEIPFAETTQAPGLLDALVSLKLVPSKGAARRLVEQGGVNVNGQRAAVDTALGGATALHGKYFLIRKGARDFGLLKTQPNM